MAVGLSNGWGAGKTLVYTDGGGVPDAEGVTLAGGDANGVFVSTERNDNGGNTSRPAVLRYDVSSPGSTLTATKDWNLTPDLPGLDDNAGLEAITWVPDSLLTAKGFVDQSTAAPYDPLLYPDHGSGLFLVGVEQDGRIIAYVLNQTAGTYKRIASIESGFPAVMGLEYEAESTHLWAACDDSCDGRTATLDIAQSGADDGRFVVTNTFARPAGMVVNLNNEGFAIAPQAECVAGLKPVFYADDGNSDQHALRSGALTCTVPPQPSPTATPTPTPLPATPTPVPPAPTPTPMVDRSAPSLKLALKFTASGKHAVRRSGKFGMVLTLGERADLTITATARKNARAKARRILQTTRKGVAAGKRTVTLSLTRKVRAKLRKGETVTLTVVARDAAGNATTSRANAKVK